MTASTDKDRVAELNSKVTALGGVTPAGQAVDFLADHSARFGDARLGGAERQSLPCRCNCRRCGRRLGDRLRRGNSSYA
jgi:hypothetical protein